MEFVYVFDLYQSTQIALEFHARASVQSTTLTPVHQQPPEEMRVPSTASEREQRGGALSQNESYITSRLLPQSQLDSRMTVNFMSDLAVDF